MNTDALLVTNTIISILTLAGVLLLGTKIIYHTDLINIEEKTNTTTMLNCTPPITPPIKTLTLTPRNEATNPPLQALT
jgi:hypothetical protein